MIFLEKLLVKINELDHMGRGMGKVNGKIVFVKNAYPLDEVYIKIIKDKKNYMIGEVVSFVKKSPFRVTPKCPILNCGCTFGSYDYKNELVFKENKIKNIMKRYAHLEGVVMPIIPSLKKYNYRNKVTLSVSEKLSYKENDSHNLINIDKCALLDEKINNLIKRINKLDLSEVKKVVIKSFDSLMVCFEGNVDYSTLKDVDSIYINNKLVYGSEKIYSKFGDFTFVISDKAFFQVNTEMALKLYETIENVITKDKNKTLLDLYSGTGTIGIFLSKYFKNVIGYEINEKAVDDARENVLINNIENAKFNVLDLNNGFNVTADTIVVDPPRSGLSKKTINDIKKICPNEIVYVSCDPMTLARDIDYLSDLYSVCKIIPVDMFSRTYHVECITLLHRRNLEK